VLNFLPDREIRLARRRYRQRLFAAAGLAIASGAAAYGLAAVPATVAAWQAADDIDGKVAALRESAENRQFSETLEAAQALRADALAVSPTLAPAASAALDAVLAKGRATIAVSSIELRRAATSTVVVTVAGVAATRESLLSFVSDLDADPQIEAALPVSDLAREKSAPFSIDAAVETAAATP